MSRIPANINLILIMIFAFFGYTSESEFTYLIPISILSIISIIITGKIEISKSDIPFAIFVLYSLSTYLYSFSRSNTLVYVFKLILLLIIYISVRQTIKPRTIVNYLLVFSGIHIIFSYLYLILPDFVLNISENILTTESLLTVESLYRRGAIAGITDQTGTNAFYISVFITIIVNKLFKGEKKFINLTFLTVGFIMLLFTQKRGLLLANLVAIAIIYVFRYVKKLDFKKIAYFVSALIFMGFIINTPLVQELFNNIVLKNSNDILGGRSNLLTATWNIGLRNWFFGTGINTIPSITGFTTHNVYLQLFAEVGLLGLTTFLVFLFENILRVFSNKNFSDNYYKDISFYFQIIFVIYCATGNPIYDLKFFIIYILFVLVGVNDSSKLKDNLQDLNIYKEV